MNLGKLIGLFGSAAWVIGLVGMAIMGLVT
jgi:hypothetical protein